MRYFNTILKVMASAILVSACAKEMSIQEPNKLENDYQYITVTLGEETKTSYTYADGELRTSWKAGDVVAITPELWRYNAAGLYQATDPSTGTFEKVSNVGRDADEYGVFYPGDKIKSTSQFTRFSYLGQVQHKSDPKGHMGEFHSMRTKTADYSHISFAGADQSACMRFNLSGMTFDHPTKLELMVLGKGKLHTNNQVTGSYSYATTEKPYDLMDVQSISMDLEGYGSETSLEAWMMMSNADVNLSDGDVLRVYVYCSDDHRYYADVNISGTMTLKGGYCHNLTISTGWKVGEGDFTKYDWDGDVVTLQSGEIGLDLVIMGDGFIREDFENGTYDLMMKQAYREFFGIEPFTTLKNGFNVYYVKTPSPERVQAQNTGSNGAINTGHVTKFSSQFSANSTAITGDDDLVIEYAKKAFSENADERIKDATIVVMVNQECRAGTCANRWYSNNGRDYGQANAIAYCALGRNAEERVQIMHHEICGHGFGKLADEYYHTTSGSISSSLMSDLDSYHALGLYRNVDKYIDDDLYGQLEGRFEKTDRTTVYWHDLFGTANNYESSDVESLGIFKGGFTYSFAFCRPTEDGSKSIMNQNTGIFNAISRRAIYYRYRRLSGEVTTNIWGTPSELDAFLTWDADVILPKILTQTKSSSAAVSPYVEGDPYRGTSILIEGHWENGRFIRK